MSRKKTTDGEGPNKDGKEKKSTVVRTEAIRPELVEQKARVEDKIFEVEQKLGDLQQETWHFHDELKAMRAELKKKGVESSGAKLQTLHERAADLEAEVETYLGKVNEKLGREDQLPLVATVNNEVFDLEKKLEELKDKLGATGKPEETEALLGQIEIDIEDQRKNLKNLVKDVAKGRYSKTSYKEFLKVINFYRQESRKVKNNIFTLNVGGHKGDYGYEDVDARSSAPEEQGIVVTGEERDVEAELLVKARDPRNKPRMVTEARPAKEKLRILAEQQEDQINGNIKAAEDMGDEDIGGAKITRVSGETGDYHRDQEQRNTHERVEAGIRELQILWTDLKPGMEQGVVALKEKVDSDETLAKAKINGKKTMAEAVQIAERELEDFEKTFTNLAKELKTLSDEDRLQRISQLREKLKKFGVAVEQAVKRFVEKGVKKTARFGEKGTLPQVEEEKNYPNRGESSQDFYGKREVRVKAVKAMREEKNYTSIIDELPDEILELEMRRQEMISQGENMAGNLQERFDNLAAVLVALRKANQENRPATEIDALLEDFNQQRDALDDIMLTRLTFIKNNMARRGQGEAVNEPRTFPNRGQSSQRFYGKRNESSLARKRKQVEKPVAEIEDEQVVGQRKVNYPNRGQSSQEFYNGRSRQRRQQIETDIDEEIISLNDEAEPDDRPVGTPTWPPSSTPDVRQPQAVQPRGVDQVPPLQPQVTGETLVATRAGGATTVDQVPPPVQVAGDEGDAFVDLNAEGVEQVPSQVQVANGTPEAQPQPTAVQPQAVEQVPPQVQEASGDLETQPQPAAVTQPVGTEQVPQQVQVATETPTTTVEQVPPQVQIRGEIPAPTSPTTTTTEARRREERRQAEKRILDIDNEVLLEMIGEQNLESIMQLIAGGNERGAKDSLKNIFSRPDIDQAELKAQLAARGYTVREFLQLWKADYHVKMFEAAKKWVAEKKETWVQDDTWNKVKRGVLTAPARVLNFGAKILPAAAALLGLAAGRLSGAHLGATATRMLVAGTASAAIGVTKYVDRVRGWFGKKREQAQGYQDKKVQEVNQQLSDSPEAMAQMLNHFQGTEMARSFSAMLSQQLAENSTVTVKGEQARGANVELASQQAGQLTTAEKDARLRTDSRLRDIEARRRQLTESIRAASPEDAMRLAEQVEELDEEKGVVEDEIEDMYESQKERVEGLIEQLNESEELAGLIEQAMDKDPKIVEVFKKLSPYAAIHGIADRIAAQDRAKQQKADPNRSNARKFAAILTCGAGGAGIGYLLSVVPELRLVLGGVVGGYLGAKFGHYASVEARKKAFKKECESQVDNAEVIIRTHEQGGIGNAAPIEALRQAADYLRTPLSLGLLDTDTSLKLRAKNALRRLDSYIISSYIESGATEQALPPEQRNRRAETLIRSLQTDTTDFAVSREKLKSDLLKKPGAVRTVLYAIGGAAAGAASMHLLMDYFQAHQQPQGGGAAAEAAHTHSAGSGAQGEAVHYKLPGDNIEGQIPEPVKIGGLEVGTEPDIDNAATVTKGGGGAWGTAQKLEQFFKDHGVKWHGAQIKGELQRHGYVWGDNGEVRHPIVVHEGAKLVPWVDKDGNGHFEFMGKARVLNHYLIERQGEGGEGHYEYSTNKTQFDADEDPLGRFNQEGEIPDTRALADARTYALKNLQEMQERMVGSKMTTDEFDTMRHNITLVTNATEAAIHNGDLHTLRAVGDLDLVQLNEKNIGEVLDENVRGHARYVPETLVDPERPHIPPAVVYKGGGGGGGYLERSTEHLAPAPKAVVYTEAQMKALAAQSSGDELTMAEKDALAHAGNKTTGGGLKEVSAGAKTAEQLAQERMAAAQMAVEIKSGADSIVDALKNRTGMIYEDRAGIGAALSEKIMKNPDLVGMIVEKQVPTIGDLTAKLGPGLSVEEKLYLGLNTSKDLVPALVVDAGTGNEIGTVYVAENPTGSSALQYFDSQGKPHFVSSDISKIAVITGSDGTKLLAEVSNGKAVALSAEIMKKLAA